MNAGSRLSGYWAVLRKHWVLLVVSVLLVLSAGGVYLWRQPAVYEAEALLLIEKPSLNLLGPKGPARNYFGVSQAALNTELILLRKDTTLATAAIEAARDEGMDTVAAGFTPGSLAARVSVSQVPGTDGLVRFALTGGDAATLPRMVEIYALKYSASAKEKRSEEFNLQLAEQQRRVKAAQAALSEAETARDTFAREHAKENLERGENPHADRRTALTKQISELQDRVELDDALAERRIRDALRDVGAAIAIDEASGEVTLAGSGTELDLQRALAASALVTGLAPIRDHREITRLRDVESRAEERDDSLREQGLLDGSEKRQKAQSDARAAREERGWVTARALEYELREIEARRRHLAKLRTDVAAAQTAEEDLNRLLGEYNGLARAVDARRREFEEARSSLDDFKSMFLRADTGDSEGAEPEDPGLRITMRVPPGQAQKVAPRVPLVIGLTIAAALATGLGLVFLFEYLDDTIRSKDDFDRYVGLPFLGFVPRISSRDHDNPDLAAESAPGSVVAEAFRAVRTSILFSRVDHPARTLLVTSAGPGEGKTTIATNLATTFARKKGPVLLVDADLRKPRVAKALGLPSDRGLANVLVGAASLDDVVRETDVEGLYAITSGPIPPNPAELLHGESMADFLREASERYECVVLDTPPLIAVSDARVLASRVDGLYLVISMGRTSRRLIQRAVESLTTIGFEVDGAILNNMSASDDRYGDYTYYARDYKADS